MASKHQLRGDPLLPYVLRYDLGGAATARGQWPVVVG